MMQTADYVCTLQTPTPPLDEKAFDPGARGRRAARGGALLKSRAFPTKDETVVSPLRFPFPTATLGLSQKNNLAFFVLWGEALTRAGSSKVYEQITAYISTYFIHTHRS